VDGRFELVVEHHREQNRRCDQQIDQRRERGGHRDDQTRKVDLREQVSLGDHAEGRLLQRLGEEQPGQQAGVGEDRIRNPIGGDLRDLAEDDGEDHHRDQRRQQRPENPENQRPENPENRLLVAHGHVAPDQKPEQLPIRPQLLEVDRAPTLGWGDQQFDIRRFSGHGDLAGAGESAPRQSRNSSTSGTPPPNSSSTNRQILSQSCESPRAGG